MNLKIVIFGYIMKSLKIKITRDYLMYIIIDKLLDENPRITVKSNCNIFLVVARKKDQNKNIFR
jgi:hypothetical protein